MMDLRENKRALLAVVIGAIGILTFLVFLVCKIVLHSGENSKGTLVAIVDYDEAYQVLTDLNTEEVLNLSVKAFDEQVMQKFEGKSYTFEEAMQSVANQVKEEDDDYRFIRLTLTASLSELYQKKKMFYVPYSATVKYNDYKEGNKDIEIAGNISYKIEDRDKITVEDRDASLEKLAGKIENYGNQMFLTELTEDGVRNQFESYFKVIEEEFQTDAISFQITLNRVSIK